MKKVLLALVAAVMVFSSCSKDEDNTQVNIYSYSVSDNEWELVDNKLYQVWIDVPQLTKNVIENGSMQVSQRIDENGKVLYTPLPAIFTDDKEGGDTYSSFTDYEYTVGGLYIFVIASDLSTTIRPGDRTFRVTIVR